MWKIFSVFLLLPGRGKKLHNNANRHFGNGNQLSALMFYVFRERKEKFFNAHTEWESIWKLHGKKWTPKMIVTHFLGRKELLRLIFKQSSDAIAEISRHPTRSQIKMITFTLQTNELIWSRSWLIVADSNRITLDVLIYRSGNGERILCAHLFTETWQTNNSGKENVVHFRGMPDERSTILRNTFPIVIRFHRHFTLYSRHSTRCG